MYYWDNHPPLYYYWLKLFGTLFGFSVPVFHLASLVPFVIGLVLALTVVRKRFGMLPVAFFLTISGLGQACLEYNLEVRMYALAFYASWAVSIALTGLLQTAAGRPGLEWCCGHWLRHIRIIMHW